MALWGGEGFPSGAAPWAHGTPLGAVFQAGCDRAMVQLELLWAGAALMLLGAAVSLCVKCHLSGKVLPVAPPRAVTLGRPFPLGMSPPGGFGPAEPRGALPSQGCSQRVEVGKVSAGGQGAADGGGKDPPTLQHPFPGAGAALWAADPSPWALWWVALGHSSREEHLCMHKSLGRAGTEGEPGGYIDMYVKYKGRGASTLPAGGSSLSLSTGGALLGGRGCGVGVWGQEWLACFAVCETNAMLKTRFKKIINQTPITTAASAVLACTFVNVFHWAF